jgi:uncharacterized membrane protein YjgN (DUF898 family)
LIISILITPPFIATIFGIIYSSLSNGGLGGLIFSSPLLIIWLLLLYTGGNYAFNNLTLAGDIRFNSSLTFFNVAIKMLIITFLPMVTFGIAYPWLKVHILRYQIENMSVIGGLEFNNNERPVDSSIFARLSRGAASALPFL